MISAAPAGQPATPEAAPAQQQPAASQAQPQGNYVTSEQLNATMTEIKRMIQSSSDKSYNRVQKMIDNMKQAGIQNPTWDQAKAMLAATGQSEQQDQSQPEAQSGQNSASSPEAAQWIRSVGGDPTQGYWNDIYDAAQEAGVGMISREDPEYQQYFMDNGKLKQYQKPRQFVRAFEQAFAAKKERLARQGNGMPGSLASSPAMGSGGGKGNFHDPKTTDRTDLISAGLREPRRR
jgi:hypothetical protein